MGLWKTVGAFVGKAVVKALAAHFEKEAAEKAQQPLSPRQPPRRRRSVGKDVDCER